MTQVPVSTSSEQTIYASLELSKNNWLLAIQLTALQEKPVKIGVQVVRHGCYVTFRLTEVVVSRDLFRKNLRRIDDLRPGPVCSLDRDINGDMNKTGEGGSGKWEKGDK